MVCTTMDLAELEGMHMRSFTITGRVALTVSLAVFAALAAVPARARSAPPVTLTWAVEFTDAPTQQAVTRYIIEPFEKAHPGVRIKFVAPSGAQGLDRYLKTSLAAGSGPDVFDENGPSWIPPFADGNQVLNLDPYAKKYGWQKTIVPWAYAASLYRGHLYAIPTEFEGLHLWYNADLMNKYGWKLPKTFDDMVKLGTSIQSKGLQVFGQGYSDCKPCWEWWVSYALTADLGNVGLYKVLTGQTPWTDPRAVDAISKIKLLWDKGFMLNKQATGVSGNDGWGLWGAGKAVLRMEGTWGFSPGLAFNYGKKFKWNIAPLPMWRKGLRPSIPIGIGEVDAVNAHTAHRAEAVAFLDWLVGNPRRAASWADKIISTFGPPLNYGPHDYPTTMDPRFKSVIDDLTRSMRDGTAGYVAWSSWPAKTEAYMWSNLEQVLLGKMSVMAYLKGTQGVFNQEKAAGKLPVVPKPAGMYVPKPAGM